MDFPITLNVPDLRPVDGSLRGIARYLVDNMSGYSETILDSDIELPTTLRVDNIVLSSASSVNRNQTLQDKTGTIALLDDVLGIRPTVILPEGLVSVDWDRSDNFLVVLSGNRQSTFYMYHSRAGMNIDLLLVNNGTNQTVFAWDPLIKWPAATAPSMPASPAGGSALLLVTIENINGTMYGEYLNYSSATPIVS